MGSIFRARTLEGALRARRKNPLKECIRSYQNYKTSGEMAALKPPSNPKIYLDEPKWPEVLPNDAPSRHQRSRQVRHAAVRRLPGPHHKMALINIQRGREDVYCAESLCYMSLPSYQFVTKTHHSFDDEIFKAPESQLDSGLTDLLEETILCNEMTSSGLSEKEKSKRLVAAIIQAVRFHGGNTSSVWVDRPRIEGFWQRSGVKLYNKETKESWFKPPFFQITKTPDFMISDRKTLREIVPRDSDVCTEPEEVEGRPFHYDPSEFGWVPKKQYVVSNPGFWFEAEHFPTLTCSQLLDVLPETLDPSVITDRVLKSDVDRQKRAAAHSLLYNFAVAVAIAYNKGFTLYDELVRPMVSQHIVSDGKTWYLSKFQLNTLAFGYDYENTRRNLAWTSGAMKLFDCVEDGKVRGLNVDVIKPIIGLMNAPKREDAEDETPFIQTGVSPAFLENGADQFKRMARREFDVREYNEREIPLWVKIYKMHKDAPNSIQIKWERPGYQHMYQYNKVLYETSVKEKTNKRRDRLLRQLYRGADVTPPKWPE